VFGGRSSVTEMNDEPALQQAEDLIDLQIKGNEWFAQPLAVDGKGDLLERFKKIDAHEAGEATSDDLELAFHKAMEAVEALFAGGAETRATIEALGTIVRDPGAQLDRRRVAAEILTDGSLDGSAAQAMMAALQDPDPRIVLAGLRAAFRVPRDVALASLEVMRGLRANADPEVSKVADINVMQLDPALKR
jgi:hypothetical protein